MTLLPYQKDMLKKLSDNFFNEISYEHRNEVEVMYQAFKARMILDLNEGGYLPKEVRS